MKKLIMPAVWLLLAVFGLNHCGVNDISLDQNQKPGMVAVRASGKSLLMGSDDPYSKKDEEQPRPTVQFSYDFFMDSTETTQKQYLDLMGWNPAAAGTVGVGPNLPVHSVTFYDALLYCNARSRAEGHDTVYAYTAMKREPSGRVYELSGLDIRYDVAGYRLPTEAEWEFAARAEVLSAFPWGGHLDSAAASLSAWYSDNALGTPRPVGLLKPNPIGLKDMLGNVMEWVNDWKGGYSPETIENFLGAKDPGLTPERSVKGGAYSFDIRYLRYGGRSANYPTLSSASAPYVGFRCAWGVIKQGRFLWQGKPYDASPNAQLKEDAASFFGYRGFKIAYVKATSSSRTLVYADLTVYPARVQEFLDDSAVFFPTISPDGRWIAYSNRDEGDRRPSSLRLRALFGSQGRLILNSVSGAIPRWWVDTLTARQYIVYSQSARNNQDPEWHLERTHRMAIDANGMASAPEAIAEGGFHDGLSSDGNFLATGFQRLKTMNRQTGQIQTLFVGPQNGKGETDTSQVCNVSLHPAFHLQRHLLLLDFGFSGQSQIVGRPYGLHEVLFRIDSSGQVVKWYGPPQDFFAWQDVEWSNHSSYAIGVGEDSSREYTALIGLNLETGKTAVIAKLADKSGATTLRQPSLWLNSGQEPQFEFDSGLRDSMANYDTPSNGYAQTEFAAKMHTLYRQRSNADVICLGSSHVDWGIYSRSFEHFHALNLGFAGGGLTTSREMFRRYAAPNLPKLRTVVLEIHPGWLFIPGGEGPDYFWRDQLSKTWGVQYDMRHGYWKSEKREALDWAFGRHPIQSTFDSLGSTTHGADGWGIAPLVMNSIGLGTYRLDDPHLTANLKVLDSLFRETEAAGVKLLMTVFPQSPLYKETEFLGRYGPGRETGKTLLNRIETLCMSSPHCRFFDADLAGAHDFTFEMFANEDHLSTAGAVNMSRKLDSVLVDWTGASP